MRIAMLALLLAAPAGASELRELCPDRPGLNTPPCIVDKGHFLVEAGLAYSQDRDANIINSEQDYGELNFRFGLTRRVEAFVGWTAHTRFRIRDRAGAVLSGSQGIGDVLFGTKLALSDPDAKKGIAVSIQPFATAPTGNNGIGAGAWTQGIILPIKFSLGGFEVQLSPELERFRDKLNGGHHAVYTGVVGVGHTFGPFDVQVELYASRDDDSGSRTTQTIADLNLALAVGENMQFDAEVDAGLNRATPDIRVAVGVTRRF